MGIDRKYSRKDIKLLLNQDGTSLEDKLKIIKTKRNVDEYKDVLKRKYEGKSRFDKTMKERKQI
tara:strand:+ start:38 stop:229 length:192 start_codon:yes stop_codon:yes gene_type:complete